MLTRSEKIEIIHAVKAWLACGWEDRSNINGAIFIVARGIFRDLEWHEGNGLGREISALTSLVPEEFLVAIRAWEKANV